MNDEKLIDALIQSAYETGYYSGKHEDGQPHHRAAIMMRNKIRRQVLVRLAHLRAAVAKARGEEGGEQGEREV